MVCRIANPSLSGLLLPRLKHADIGIKLDSKADNDGSISESLRELIEGLLISMPVIEDLTIHQESGWRGAPSDCDVKDLKIPCLDAIRKISVWVSPLSIDFVHELCIRAFANLCIRALIFADCDCSDLDSCAALDSGSWTPTSRRCLRGRHES